MMETIEELARRAAAVALADAADVADPDDGLRRIREHAAAAPAVVRPRRRSPRRWVVLGAAAAIAVAVGVLVAGRGDTRQLGPDPTPSPVSTGPAPTPTAPSTTPTTTTTSTVAPATEALTVSYLDPPPLLSLHEFAVVPLPGEVDAPYLGGVVTEDGVLLRVGERSYVLVQWDGTQTPVEFDVPLALWVAGPGRVAYGTTGDPRSDYRLAAVAYGGERAGEEVWSMPVNPGGDMLGEVPFGAWGHGPSGLTQRDVGFGGRRIAGYVDERGDVLGGPIDAPDVYLTRPDDGVGPDVVRSVDGTRTWELDITAHADAPRDLLKGDPQPTPTPDGGAVIWRPIGENTGSGGWADSTVNVFAQLRPDGSGSWFTMPEGVTVLASDLWGTVFSSVDATSVHLATADLAAASSIPGRCAGDPRAVVDRLVAARANGGVDCLDPSVLAGADTPPCWVVCSGSAFVAADAGEVGEWFNPVSDESGWSVPVAVTFTNEFGFRSQRVERWTLRRDDTGDLAVTGIDVEWDAGDVAVSEQRVRDYLGALADGRYDDAATLLDDGAASFADRVDLQPLDPEAENDLAGALRAWCEEPPVNGEAGSCGRPVQLSVDLTPTGPVTTAWYLIDGRVVTGTFRGFESEGVPGVRGVPPRTTPLGAAEVAAAAADLGAARMLVAADTGFWLVADGMAVFVETGAPGWGRIDDGFVYWGAWDDDRRTQRSSAYLLDGTEVCAVEGSIHHVRVRADGSYVATVERPTGEPVGGAQRPVRAFAVDCATGDEQAIDPLSSAVEAGSRSTIEVDGRTFAVDGDAEGNVVITDDDGIRLTGPDWAVDAAVSDDGDTLVAAVGGNGDPGVHDTNRLVARDTATGAVRWSVSLSQRFSTIWIAGDRVVVVHEPPTGVPMGMVQAEYTVVDLATGAIVGSVPGTLQILDLS